MATTQTDTQDRAPAAETAGAPAAAQKRAKSRRIYSYPVLLVVTVVLAVGLIYLFHLYLPDTAATILIDRFGPTYPYTVQNTMWVTFVFGFAELLLRWRDGVGERRELGRGYLPEDERTILQAPELRDLYARARAETQGDAIYTGRFLPRLIQRAVAQFQTSNSINQANTLLNSSLELFLHEIDLRYQIIRYIVWVIPTLGFIGTVVGISLALAYAGVADPQDPDLLLELTKRLAVAFNTTLLALVMSAILVLLQHIIQAYEERTLNRAGQYCLDNLINRLYER